MNIWLSITFFIVVLISLSLFKAQGKGEQYTYFQKKCFEIMDKLPEDPQDVRLKLINSTIYLMIAILFDLKSLNELVDLLEKNGYNNIKESDK